MKKFTKQEILELYGQVTLGEISFSQMVEIMNKRVREADKPCVEDISVRKFKKGDKVRIKEGISSKTHRDISPGFIVQMDDLIGKELTVDRYANGMVYTEESYYLHEGWLEPYEGLKKGDLAIFWDDDKEYAVVKIYERFDVLYKDFQ
ncbi:MAG: hypothetical protein EOM76_12460, partial [Sphingobacteriia bacterium]|nr:hypothetical protein [Sphingobacteriia bacterium]